MFKRWLQKFKNNVKLSTYAGEKIALIFSLSGAHAGGGLPNTPE